MFTLDPETRMVVSISSSRYNKKGNKTNKTKKYFSHSFR
jgi:hypothetical protein